MRQFHLVEKVKSTFSWFRARIPKMQTVKPALYAGEGLLVASTFFFIVQFFPTGGLLIQDGSLVNFWGIPMIFHGVAFVLSRPYEDGVQIPWWILWLCSRVAGGVWLGLSFGTILILNEWYADPDYGKWEPLFTATGLSAAGVLAAQRWFDKMAKGEGNKKEAPEPIE